MNPEALRRSPWAPWLGHARLAVDRWLVVFDRVVPWRGEPVDVVIEENAGSWSMRLGDRDLPDRLKQAHGVLMLATLEAIEDVPMVRDALWELEFGRADEVVSLFGAGAPLGLDQVALRLTDGVRRTGVTCGLAELIGAELSVQARHVPVRTLRALALDAVEHGRVATMLDWDGRVIRTTSRPIPLPRRWCQLHTVSP